MRKNKHVKNLMSSWLFCLTAHANGTKSQTFHQCLANGFGLLALHLIMGWFLKQVSQFSPKLADLQTKGHLRDSDNKNNYSHI